MLKKIIYVDLSVTNNMVYLLRENILKNNGTN